MTAVKFDDIFLNMPEDWRGSPQKERFVSLLQLLSQRTGGGSVDTIDAINTSITAIETNVATNTTNISTNATNIATNTANITTQTLKTAILELLQFSSSGTKKMKDRSKYNTWGIL